MIHHQNTFLRSALVRNPFAFGEFGPQAIDVLRMEQEFPMLFNYSSNKSQTQANVALPKQNEASSRLTESITFKRTPTPRNNSACNGKVVLSSGKTKLSGFSYLGKLKEKPRVPVPTREICKPIKKEPVLAKPCSKGIKCEARLASSTINKSKRIFTQMIKPKAELINTQEKFSVKSNSCNREPKENTRFNRATIHQRITEQVVKRPIESIPLHVTNSDSKNDVPVRNRHSTPRKLMQKKELKPKPKKNQSFEITTKTFGTSLDRVTESGQNNNLKNQLVEAEDIDATSNDLFESLNFEFGSQNEMFSQPLGLTSWEQLKFANILALNYEDRGLLIKDGLTERDRLSTIDSIGSQEKAPSEITDQGSTNKYFPSPETQVRQNIHQISPPKIVRLEPPPKHGDNTSVAAFSMLDSFELEEVNPYISMNPSTDHIDKIDIGTDVPEDLFQKYLEFFLNNKSLVSNGNEEEQPEFDITSQAVNESNKTPRTESSVLFASEFRQLEQTKQNEVYRKPQLTDQEIQTQVYAGLPLSEIISRIVIEHRFPEQRTRTTSKNNVHHGTDHYKYASQGENDLDSIELENLINVLDKCTEITPDRFMEPQKEKKSDFKLLKPVRKHVPNIQDLEIDLTDCTSFSEFTESELEISQRGSKAFTTSDLKLPNYGVAEDKSNLPKSDVKSLLGKQDKSTSFSRQVINADKSTLCCTVEPNNEREGLFSEESNEIQKLYTRSISLGEALFDPVRSPGEISLHFERKTFAQSTSSRSQSKFYDDIENLMTTELDVSSSSLDFSEDK